MYKNLTKSFSTINLCKANFIIIKKLHFTKNQKSRYFLQISLTKTKNLPQMEVVFLKKDYSALAVEIMQMAVAISSECEMLISMLSTFIVFNII